MTTPTCYYPGCGAPAARHVFNNEIACLNFCAVHLAPETCVSALRDLSRHVAELGASDDEDDADWITMHSGKQLTQLAPTIETITFDDMALGLAREPRFSGQTDSRLEPYSVGQHSVLVVDVLRRQGRPLVELQWGAVHDGSEGIGYKDIPRPFKRTSAMRGYRRAEKVAMHAIADAFGLPREMPASVKTADLAVFECEQAYLMHGFPLEDLELVSQAGLDLKPWSWRTAWVNYTNLCADLGLTHVLYGAVQRPTDIELFRRLHP